MVRAKLTRADGSVLELEGTSEEVAAVLAWERPAQMAPLQPIVVPIPHQPVWPFGPFTTDGTGTPLPPNPTIICAVSGADIARN